MSGLTTKLLEAQLLDVEILCSAFPAGGNVTSKLTSTFGKNKLAGGEITLLTKVLDALRGKAPVSKGGGGKRARVSATPTKPNRADPSADDGDNDDVVGSTKRSKAPVSDDEQEMRAPPLDVSDETVSYVFV